MIMRRVLVALSVIAVAGSTLAACEPVSLGGSVQKSFPEIRSKAVQRVEVIPFPEGPPALRFSRNARGLRELPLRLIADALPRLLPPPLAQASDCDVGSVVTISVDDAGEVTYGPCKRPPAIEELRQAVIAFDAPPTSAG